MAIKRDPWWKMAVFYQIYPRSFLDTTGNGVGDLPGITSRLSYLKKDLGVDAIWISPFYPSPGHDFGYDVADYTSINPLFGTMADFDDLLAKSHELDLKIVLDLVLNHTSYEHPWFKESSSHLDNPKRDWYIWRDGKGKKKDKPPNNWKSDFGGSAWTFDPHTGQFYYHHFLPEQPDLNYRNPEVKKAIFNAIRFWLEKGVDGFRLDVISHIYEDPSLPDNPRSWRLLPSDNNYAYFFQDHIYDKNLPENIDFVKELRALLDVYEPQRMMVGEVIGPPESVRNFYGIEKNGSNDGLHLCFNFLFTSSPFNPQEFRKRISRIESILPDPFYPCYVFGNHDRPRTISRYGNSVDKARVLATLLLTLRCAPFIYYGEEIGMKSVKISRSKILDPIGKKFWWSPIPVGRDVCRTPMQWNETKHAGFSTADSETWLPVSSKFKKINLENQLSDQRSLFHLYKELLRIRKASPALTGGSITFLETNKYCLAYLREHDHDIALVLLNFSSKEHVVRFHDERVSNHEWLLVYPGEDFKISPENWAIPRYGISIWRATFSY
ncbi:MAG: alpha-amylase family glycosyl hydrolase [Candidatus Hodarchaeales archaeon]